MKTREEIVDPHTGRKTMEPDVLDHITRYAYNDQGRMTGMHTFREGSGWESWPEGAAGPAFPVLIPV